MKKKGKGELGTKIHLMKHKNILFVKVQVLTQALSAVAFLLSSSQGLSNTA